MIKISEDIVIIEKQINVNHYVIPQEDCCLHGNQLKLDNESNIYESRDECLAGNNSYSMYTSNVFVIIDVNVIVNELYFACQTVIIN